MTQRIIYPTDDGGVAIIVPAPEYLAEHTIEELAAKDVPAGKPYKIVDVASAAANASVRLIGLSTAVEDTATDAYLTVEVQISEHQFVADKAAI